MDAEMQRALSDWGIAQMKEFSGPSVTPETNTSFTAHDIDAYAMFRAVVPEVAELIIETHSPHMGWMEVWTLLDDHTIGVLMKAGAVNYLPSVAAP